MPGLFQDLINPFQQVPNKQYGMVGQTIGRGSLVTFSYPYSQAVRPNVIHDPYPLVIVTDIWPRHLRGVNLHYITFPYIKNILQSNCGNSSYSYFQVKGDRYIADAFRMYYRSGMSNVKVMDCSFLLNILGAVRSWSETEIEAVKQSIQKQIQQKLQQKADDMTKASQEQSLSFPQNQQVGKMAAQVQGAFQPPISQMPQQQVAPAQQPVQTEKAKA